MATTDYHGVIVHLDIPLDHHPDVIMGDSTGATLGRQALIGIYETYGKINDRASRVQDKGRLASAAQLFAEVALNRVGRAITSLTQQIDHLDNEIGATLMPSKSTRRCARVNRDAYSRLNSLKPDATRNGVNQMTNESPSMKTWQTDTYVTWAVLGEIIAALDIDAKINWQIVISSAQKKSGDQQLAFIQQTVKGMRDAVAIAKNSNSRASRRSECGLRKVRDSDYGKSRTAISLSPGQ